MAENGDVKMEVKMENENSAAQTNKRSIDNGENSTSASGKRVKQEGVEMRCLVPGRSAGGIIGKGGCKVKELRENYQAVIFLAKGDSMDKVLKVTATPENCGKVILDLLPILEGRKNDEYDDDNRQAKSSVKLLVHSSQAGGIIGTKGCRIKELQEKSGAFIKIHQECLGYSTDRLCQVSGTHDVIGKCVELIVEVLESIPPKGPVYEYDPNEEAYGYGGDDYGYGPGGYGGGYGDFGGFGGFGGMGGFGAMGGYGQGGYGGNFGGRGRRGGMRGRGGFRQNMY